MPPKQSAPPAFRLAAADTPVIPPCRSPDTAVDAEDTRLSLTVVSSQTSQGLVLTVAGSVDLVTAPNLGLALELALVTSPRTVVVDLSAVPLLACAGLSVLIAAHQRAEGRTCLRVVAPRRSTRRPLELTGVDKYLSVHDTCAEALAEPLRDDRDRPAADG